MKWSNTHIDQVIILLDSGEIAHYWSNKKNEVILK